MSESKQLQPIEEIKNNLDRMDAQLKDALPAHVPVARFKRHALTALNNNPSLMKCDRRSLYNAVLRCAQRGLLPDGREAAIVPFKDQCAVIDMVEGVLKLIRNSGELKSITSQVVYSGDVFRYWVDSEGEHLEHQPNMFGDRGKRVGVYAIAKTINDGVYIEVLTVADVEAIKNVSRSRDSGPWNGPFDSEMFRKSAIKRLAKRLPKSTDLDPDTYEDDDLITSQPEPKVFDGEPAVASDPVEKKPRQSKTAKLVQESVGGKDAADLAKEEHSKQAAAATKPYNHAPGADNPPPQEGSPI